MRVAIAETEHDQGLRRRTYPQSHGSCLTSSLQLQYDGTYRLPTASHLDLSRDPRALRCPSPHLRLRIISDLIPYCFTNYEYSSTSAAISALCTVRAHNRILEACITLAQRTHTLSYSSLIHPRVALNAPNAPASESKAGTRAKSQFARRRTRKPLPHCTLTSGETELTPT
jgi:hypothetical protein